MTDSFLDRLLRQRFGPALLLAAGVAYHYLCHSLMLLPVLWNELRPAPHLVDLVLDHIPLVPVIARYNYYLWIAAYIPLAFLLFRRDKKAFARFMLLGGLLSLLRGAIVPLTGLGPCQAADVHNQHALPFLQTWWTLVNPYSALVKNAAGVALTKDLFFSGHVATTFLLYLYGRRIRGWDGIFLAANLLTTLCVFFSHLHYTIDVIGAYAITFCVYHLLEPRLQRF
jgi:hypothetical protein